MFALPILEAKWFLSGFYPRDCRYESSEVRVKPHLPLRWWLAHLSRFCRPVHAVDLQLEDILGLTDLLGWAGLGFEM